MTFVWKTLAVVAGLYGLVVLAAFAGQRRLMYFPDPRRTSPADMGLANVEEVELAPPDGAQVIAWWSKAPPGQPTLLYFHGNAGSLAFRSERIRRYQNLGRGIFMMSYRGYSGSTGSPSEAANVADASLACSFLINSGIAAGDIILYGESLGSGVAVQVAKKEPVGGLILDAPYTSAADVGTLRYPYLPVRPLLRDRYETISHIAGVTVPLLVLHGERDAVVPVAMGRKVFAAAPGSKQIITFPLAGHEDHYLFGSYDVINGWIDRLRTKPPAH